MPTENYLLLGQKKRLIESLRQKGITDENVLNAFDKMERHRFLESLLWPRAYEDVALKLTTDQTISKPSTVAFQSQLLEVKKGMKVLEIGTGSGYQACVLAAMGTKVHTIERQRNLYFHTKEILEQLPYRIKAFLGDGFEGLPTYAPFDRILITAGAPLIPPKLIEQLKPNGIMVIPIDEGEPGHQKMRRITKNPDGTLREEVFGDFTFVPMLTGTGND